MSFQRPPSPVPGGSRAGLSLGSYPNAELPLLVTAGTGPAPGSRLPAPSAVQRHKRVQVKVRIRNRGERIILSLPRTCKQEAAGLQWGCQQVPAPLASLQAHGHVSEVQVQNYLFEYSALLLFFEYPKSHWVVWGFVWRMNFIKACSSIKDSSPNKMHPHRGDSDEEVRHDGSLYSRGQDFGGCRLFLVITSNSL